MAQLMMMKVAYRNLVSILLLVIIASSCSVSKQINKQASKILFVDSTISTGFMGISIYDVADDRYLYNYNADKYFVPASNTKLFSLYAGMKYLGDSLVGLRYTHYGISDTDKILILSPTGDPTFLHSDFKTQPVFDFLKKDAGNFSAFCIDDTVWKDKSLGYGWSWDDYNSDYMVERSSFPIFGNTVSFKLRSTIDTDGYFLVPEINPDDFDPFLISPEYLDSSVSKSLGFNLYLHFNERIKNDKNQIQGKFEIKRDMNANHFSVVPSETFFKSQTIPLHIESNNSFQKDFIETTFNKYPIYSFGHYKDSSDEYLKITSPNARQRSIKLNQFKIIHSQPSDSLFTPMMHRSDNFFAEQTLLMASNEKLGYMKDEDIIDTLLNTDLKDIPQRPQWVDGSGLSRYNLFTPQDFIYILNKLKSDFGLERVKKILPTGGTGTLKRYFNSDSGFIFAKTGTLSNHVALSGYLITKKNKLLLFSILNNNYEGSSTSIRRAVEKFLQQLREKY